MANIVRKNMPTNRALKAYAFDPSQGHNLGNYMSLQVPYEEFECAGPVGKYLAVIDYDSSNDTYYRPVDLDDPAILIRNGLDPSESDPQFHQQMVYAVASKTIERFEFALGRKIKFEFRHAPKNDPHAHRLKIYPHGMQDANAFYSRELRALVFGYFQASETDPGSNLPGQTIFTCLSHDIIVHEMTHSLVDGQREYFLESTNNDTVAFHEGFADIVALFQHFSIKEALLDTIIRTGGLIHRMEIDPEVQPQATGPMIQPELTEENPMVQLARQFGHAMGMRSALRSAIGTPPNSRALEKMFEPHDRGSILVAAVFDAFFTMYLKRTRDLMRIARSGGMAFSKDMHPDLANRLASEAVKTAEHFSNICIRALDYCPPVDILFGDFLRALITADQDIVSDDPYGYREAIINAFRLRGIQPENVTSYAEEAIRWAAPEEFEAHVPERWRELSAYLFAEPNRDILSDSARRLHKFATSNCEALNLDPKYPLSVHSFHPLNRISPSGKLQHGVVAEILQHRSELLDPSDPKSAFEFRGGITLILDQDGNVVYVIHKKLGPEGKDNARLNRLRDYYATRRLSSPQGAYVNPFVNTLTHFSNIHRGY